MSTALPPAAKFLEVDQPAAVLVDRLEGGANLRPAEADAQRIEEPGQLGLVDLAVPIAIETVEALAQWVLGHVRKVRRFFAQTNCALVLGAAAASLPPLQASWLERIGTGKGAVVVTPPVGATDPRPLVVGVHGAGDRPEWSCGGWRLASQVSAFIACPQGTPGGGRFAWTSSRQLAQRVETAVAQTRARFGEYVDSGPMIYAGFSQGATLAEPLLREHAGRFPIAILAEGGYQTSRSASFARAFRERGGRRVVLVCGTPSCFRSARAASKVLTSAGLETLVVGDEKAGHNLNERMQKALQEAWPRISAPLVSPAHEH